MATKYTRNVSMVCASMSAVGMRARACVCVQTFLTQRRMEASKRSMMNVSPLAASASAPSTPLSRRQSSVPSSQSHHA
ncbi:hypothetical protein EON67_09100 [archaeon]|nr:MAG: hypothetical protein EON67_09100 [archaeon]